ncbi:MAG: C10 family peptidase [Saprospiraceae bacterium]
MKKLNLLKQFTIVLLALLTCYSCQKETAIEVKPDNNSEYAISETLAMEYATKAFGTEANKTVKSIDAIPDENAETAYYIINYESGGFLILAADRRSAPVLAYSDKSDFPLDQEVYSNGLVEWLFDTKEKIKAIKTLNGTQSDFVRVRWSALVSGTSLINDRGENTGRLIPEPTGDGDPNCDPYTIIKGPYLNTTWGQGCGYNANTPLMTCGGQCGRAWTGCVATAMAQVMRYHQFPTSYAWGSMPNGSGTSATATLMRDIGDEVNMDYDCDGSGASTQNEVASSFTGDFGYASASYNGYNYQTVKSELNYARPVILRGGKKNGWWIFSTYSNGHAWVCDGYRRTVYPCYGSTLYYHMNWGWNGSFNGNYAFNNFNPSTHTFNYKRGMVTNIKP